MVDDNVNQDGGDVEGNEDDYEEEDVISQGEQGSTTTLPVTEMHCCCDKNSAAIQELSRKFDTLEAKMQLRPQLSPSYEELLAKVKTLEDERDSLLTALRLSQRRFQRDCN